MILDLLQINPPTTQTAGLVIGFSHPVSLVPNPTNGPNDQYIFEVELPLPNQSESGFRCRCPIVGKIVPVKITTSGTLIIDAQPTPWPAPGIAFVVTSPVSRRFLEAGTEVFVVLRGDSVVDQRGNAVDAEFVRATLPTGDRRKASGGPLPAVPPDSLLSIQGGRFESWFSTQREA